jgi:hypothetical protein
MPHFGARSKTALGTCDPRLVEIATLTIRHFDFTVLEGFRAPELQQAAYESGASSVQKGKHNVFPSLAFDLAPYPIEWHNIPRFCILAGYIFEASYEVGVTLRWGGFWQHPFDPGHFEITDKAGPGPRR